MAISDLIAQLQAAQATASALATYISGLESSNASLTAKVSALQAQLDAANAQIAALEAQINNTPTTTQQTLWGYAASDPQEDATERVLGTANAGALRYYQQPNEGIKWPSEMTLGNRVLIYSSKVNPKEIAAGNWDSQYVAFFKAAPTDRPTYVCVWHEPEDNIEKGEFSATDFTNAWKRVAGLAKPYPNVKMTLILMGWTLSDPKRNFNDYYAGDAYVDVLAWDPYAFSPTNPKDITQIFAKEVALAKSLGKPWAVAETGVDNQSFTGQARYNALTALAAAAKKDSPLFVTYFDRANWVIHNDPKAIAAWTAGQQ